MERCKYDHLSTNDPSFSGDDSSNTTFFDVESNQATSMNTSTVVNSFSMVPNSTLFSVDTMITKTNIKNLHLGSACQRKLTAEMVIHQKEKK